MTARQLVVRRRQLIFSTETPAFIPPTLWPPNSPDVNPVDYKVWLVIQEQVYKVKVSDVDELHQHIQTVWDELDQRIIHSFIHSFIHFFKINNDKKHCCDNRDTPSKIQSK